MDNNTELLLDDLVQSTGRGMEAKNKLIAELEKERDAIAELEQRKKNRNELVMRLVDSGWFTKAEIAQHAGIAPSTINFLQNRDG